MNRFSIFVSAVFVVLFFSSWTLTPDGDCEVLLAKISGKYEGDCKRGKAHGEGKAVGEDTYEGEFKKGLPDGKGKYTWSNGDVFDGIWKNGLKEGEGKLVVKGSAQKADSIVVGFWKADEYFGKYENPYEIGSKSSNINKILCVKKGITPKQIEIIATRKNVEVEISKLRIDSSNGSYYDKKFMLNEFPLELEIEFDAASATGMGASKDKFSTLSGSEGKGGALKEKFTCKVKILEEGNWQITIDLSNV